MDQEDLETVRQQNCSQARICSYSERLGLQDRYGSCHGLCSRDVHAPRALLMVLGAAEASEIAELGIGTEALANGELRHLADEVDRILDWNLLLYPVRMMKLREIEAELSLATVRNFVDLASSVYVATGDGVRSDELLQSRYQRIRLNYREGLCTVFVFLCFQTFDMHHCFC